MVNEWLGRFVSRQFSVVWVAVILGTLLAHSVASAAPKSKKIDFWDDSEEQSELNIDHSKWAEILQTYVITDHPSGVNRFNYAAVTPADKLKLEEYLEYMQKMDPRQLTKTKQKAYWLNMFNAALIQEVLESEPEDSIREVGRSLWRSNRLYVAMQDTSLDNIEHGILRPIFNDPRVHFSLAAGTVGSASIPSEPFNGANVESLLEKNTQEFLNHERGVSVNDRGVVLSSIFKWYVDDFGGDYEGVKRFILPYLSGSIAQAVAASKRARYSYEWDLNKP